MKKILLIAVCVFLAFSVSCKKDEDGEAVVDNELQEEMEIDEKYAESKGVEYLDALFAGDYERAYDEFAHDEAMMKAVNPETYEAIFNDLYEKNGVFGKFSGSKVERQGEYIIFTYGVVLEDGEINANAVFDKAGNIAGLNFSEYTFESEPVSMPTEEELTKLAIDYLGDLVAGGYDDAYNNYPHNSQMTEMVSPEEYENIFKEIEKTSGKFKRFEGSEVSEKGMYTIVAVGALFEIQSYNMNVVFDNAGKIAGLNFSLYTFGPEVLPEGVVEEDIEFGFEEWRLSGKISMPEAKGIYPLLVLVHGSGPNNMNETVGLNEPFKDIAHKLSQNGIAVLRYDKRTYTYGERIAGLKDFTVYDETIEDAAEAVRYAYGLEYIDKDSIFVMGHSLGAYLMPRIAEITPEADGYIMASGIYSSLAEIIPYQIDYLNNLDGKITDEEKARMEETEAMVYKMLHPYEIEENEIVFGAYKAYWEDLSQYDPIELASEIEKPVYVFQGDRDYQVPVKEYSMIFEELNDKKNFEFKLYEGLNHLLIYGEDKSTPREYYIKGEVYGPLLEDIIEFMKGGY